MVSAITTTGATMFDDPDRLNGTLHLWRSLVGWLGGLLMWVAASAILAPLNLGGFEVTARAEPGRSASRDIGMSAPEIRERLAKVSAVLVPIYAGLTMLLWVLLAVGGDAGLVALCHAMAILATSGISPVGGLGVEGSGMAGEAVMLLFMLFALSRLTFSTDTTTAESGGLLQDPEFRIGVAVVIAVPVFLFLRHFLGAFDVAAENDLADAGRALWGSAFTVLSFLTTTGFASAHWVDGAVVVRIGNAGSVVDGAGVDRRRCCDHGWRGQAASGVCTLSQWRSRDGATGAPVLCQQCRAARAAAAKGWGVYRVDLFHAVCPYLGADHDPVVADRRCL